MDWYMFETNMEGDKDSTRPFVVNVQAKNKTMAYVLGWKAALETGQAPDITTAWISKLFYSIESLPHTPRIHDDGQYTELFPLSDVLNIVPNHRYPSEIEDHISDYIRAEAFTNWDDSRGIFIHPNNYKCCITPTPVGYLVQFYFKENANVKA